MEPELLALYDVSRIYGKEATQVYALTDVSLSITTGEFVSIVVPQDAVNQLFSTSWGL